MEIMSGRQHGDLCKILTLIGIEHRLGPLCEMFVVLQFWEVDSGVLKGQYDSDTSSVMGLCIVGNR